MIDISCLYVKPTMATFATSPITITTKRVTFALDDADLLLKPRPSMVAVYVKFASQLIATIKTAAEIEAEEFAEFKKLRESKQILKAEKHTCLDEHFLTEDDDLNDAMWELLQNAIKLDVNNL
jgi:hypothetical protein